MPMSLELNCNGAHKSYAKYLLVQLLISSEGAARWHSFPPNARPANKYPYIMILSTAEHMFIMTFSDALEHK